MTIQQIIDDKSIKRLEKRKALIEGIINGSFDFSAISAACSFLPEKKHFPYTGSLGRSQPFQRVPLEEDYLNLSERYILSPDPSCKREASRIVGNLAAAFPANLDHAIDALLQNAEHDGTVIRWASAYALARIVLIPQYVRGPLFEQVSRLCEKEQENGVRTNIRKR